jgi:hypothetical protein
MFTYPNLLRYLVLLCFMTSFTNGTIRICVQELVFLEPSVTKCNACSDIREEYCERYQLISLRRYLLRTLSFIGHLTHALCFNHL